METKITGTVIVVGDNIDTDQIYPGRYLALTDPAEIGNHCLEGISPGIADSFPENGIVVAGSNFGCGSSREHAPIALVNMGAKAVLADSFARIFFRNGINLGLPLVTCQGVADHVKNGNRITIDMEKGKVFVHETGEEYDCDRLGNQTLMILQAGGIKPLMRARIGNDK